MNLEHWSEAFESKVLESIGLTPEHLASSFGKTTRKDAEIVNPNGQEIRTVL